MRRRLAWAVGAAAALGVAAGLGAFTFVYAKGASYLTTDAASCADCHIMEEHYSAWLKSSHRNVAKCADCHMPHDVLGKYAAKASNGSGIHWLSRPAGFPTRCRSSRITARSRSAPAETVTMRSLTRSTPTGSSPSNPPQPTRRNAPRSTMERASRERENVRAFAAIHTLATRCADAIPSMRSIR